MPHCELKREISDYGLLPLVPGILEAQILYGRADERTRSLAQLPQNYGKHNNGSTTPDCY